MKSIQISGIHIGLSLLFYLAFPGERQAQAQIRVGNGGDVIDCKASSENALDGLYSLDFLLTGAAQHKGSLETTTLKPLAVQDAKENLRRIARIISNHLPDMGSSLSLYADLVGNNDPTRARLWQSAPFGLIDIQDEMIVDALPANCLTDGRLKLIQAAIRLTPVAAGVADRTVVYKYMPEVFARLERDAPLQLSFMLLHEWLWDVSSDAQANRNINRLMHWDGLGGLTSAEFVARLKAFGVSDAALSVKALVDEGAKPSMSPDAMAVDVSSRERDIQRLDTLHAIWSRYKHFNVIDGRVVSHDEGGITTSEGQAYAMLRAVWSADQEAFEKIYEWTNRHLRRKDDALFSWKWRHQVIDTNSASDADTDIALALIIASRKFESERYRTDALRIIADLWEKCVGLKSPKKLSESTKNANMVVKDPDRVTVSAVMSAGNWTAKDRYKKVHIGYFAPYAYREFARLDSGHPWQDVVDSGYEILEWLRTSGHRLPPEFVWFDAQSGKLSLRHPRTGQSGQFGYDVYPLFWRLAVDHLWSGRLMVRDTQVEHYLGFFADELKAHETLYEKYSLAGQPLSRVSAPTLMATVGSLAYVTGVKDEVYRFLDKKYLASESAKAATDPHGMPYYFQNWLWFYRALEGKQIRSHDEFLGFLRPFDWESFTKNFPFLLVGVLVIGYLFRKRSKRLSAAVALVASVLIVRYLWFRAVHTLNFETVSGALASIALFGAEVYSAGSLALLAVQSRRANRPRSAGNIADKGYGEETSVDVFIPIYNEPLEILELTLIAATKLRYANKTIHVCDDGRRSEVADLAARLGARYIEGPRKHAKAGNINHALTRSKGDLVAIFDTDHLPTTDFLVKTVSPFADSKVGFVQTPHFFYNEDIFQKAFRSREAMPNEQDYFNRGIQPARDGWGGCIFVGSGAVFRRSALVGVGGIQLLSITEDVHTSQKLHAAGWKSVFVDEPLAAGLAAETVSAHFVQRRRWMLGCLQILFKDNPLLEKRLPLRFRVGYFASLYYFLFPLARVVFWFMPLIFLYFHVYPILSDVSTLLALMLPSLLASYFLAQILVPGWPRLFWNGIYESAFALPMLRAMFDLLVPGKLGFKVTPKGVQSTRCEFDVKTLGMSLVAVGISVVAVGKGLFEFFYFGIEKDAYFFNIAWASLNLGFLCLGLVVGLERPQRRRSERVLLNTDPHIKDLRVLEVSWDRPGLERTNLRGKIKDISTTGLCFGLENIDSTKAENDEELRGLPSIGTVVSLVIDGAAVSDGKILLEAEVVWISRGLCGVRYKTLDDGAIGEVVGKFYCNSALWRSYSHSYTASTGRAISEIFLGMFRNLALTFTQVRRRKRSKRAVKVASLTLLICGLGLSQEPVFAAGESVKVSWYMLNARTNMKIGNMKAAIESLEKVVVEDPQNREAQQMLGAAYEKQGLLEKAVEQNDRYIARFPDAELEILFKQANFLLAPRYAYRSSDAAKLFEKALAKEPRFAERRRYAQLLTRRTEGRAAAIQQYQMLLTEQPDNGDVQYEYRQVLLGSNHTEDRERARFEFKKYVKHNPTDLKAKRQLGILSADIELSKRRQRSARASISDELREAQEILEPVCKRQPSDIEVCLRVARIKGVTPGQYDEAINAYRNLLKFSRAYSFETEYADLLATDAARTDEAIRRYQSLSKQRPADAGVRLKLANLLARQEATCPAANAEYAKVLDLQGRHTLSALLAYRGLARCHAWIGKSELALYYAKKSEEHPLAGRGDEAEGDGEESISKISDDVTEGRAAGQALTLSGALKFRSIYHRLLLLQRGMLGPFFDYEAGVGHEQVTDRGKSSSNGRFDRSALGGLLFGKLTGRWNGSLFLTIEPVFTTIGPSKKAMNGEVSLLWDATRAFRQSIDNLGGLTLRIGQGRRKIYDSVASAAGAIASSVGEPVSVSQEYTRLAAGFWRRDIMAAASLEWGHWDEGLPSEPNENEFARISVDATYYLFRSGSDVDDALVPPTHRSEMNPDSGLGLNFELFAEDSKGDCASKESYGTSCREHYFRPHNFSQLTMGIRGELAVGPQWSLGATVGPRYERMKSNLEKSGSGDEEVIGAGYAGKLELGYTDFEAWVIKGLVSGSNVVHKIEEAGGVISYTGKTFDAAVSLSRKM